jgi:hypothetical protein
MTAHRSARHLDEGDVVRFLDGEGTLDEQRQWDSHLLTCGRCKGEVEELRAGSRAIAEWLARAAFEDDLEDASPRPRSGAPHEPGHGLGGRVLGGRVLGGRVLRRPWLEAAVIALLLAAPVVAIPAAREWVLGRLTPGAEPVAPATAAVEGEPDRQPVMIRFQPVAGSFLVEIAATQRGGTLTLARSMDDEAAFEVGAGSDGPETTVSAQGIRVDNQATTRSSYRLSLPGQVDGVSVVVEGRRVEVAAREIDRGLVLRLDRSGEPR